jgi:hypothetical protein
MHCSVDFILAQTGEKRNRKEVAGYFLGEERVVNIKENDKAPKQQVNQSSHMHIYTNCTFLEV